jgi:2-iminobutanoate/2-iminopropanoate deaminase
VLGKSTAAYSQGLVAPAGETTYVAGQIALDGVASVIAAGDMESQARQVFGQISKILEEAGGSIRNVANITTYVTDMNQYRAFAKVRAEVLQPPSSASTAVEVNSVNAILNGAHKNFKGSEIRS